MKILTVRLGLGLLIESRLGLGLVLGIGLGLVQPVHGSSVIASAATISPLAK